MASTSTPSSDYGSWTQYGWRVGPVPRSTQRPEILKYGAGMQYAPLFTYNFEPGAIVAANVCPSVTPVSLTPMWVPMVTATPLADQVVLPYYGAPYVPYGNTTLPYPTQVSAGGTLAVQFQYPCAVVLNAAVATSGIVLTVFGYDWYMQPMQENITVGGGGPYVAPNTNQVQYGKKAFYGITGVWYSGVAITNASAVTVTTSTLYGLPYRLNDISQIVQYGEAPDLPPPLAVAAVAGVSTPSNSTSGDVRGTVYTPTVPGSGLELSLTYFVQGASPWQAMMSKISAGDNPSQTSWATATQVSAPNVDDLFGVSQFYTGEYSAV